MNLNGKNVKLLGSAAEGLAAAAAGPRTNQDMVITKNPTIELYAIQVKPGIIGGQPIVGADLPIDSKILSFIVHPQYGPHVWVACYKAREHKWHAMYIVQAGMQMPDDCRVEDLLGNASIIPPGANQGISSIHLFKRGEWPTIVSAQLEAESGSKPDAVAEV